MKKILIVDDQELNRRLMEEILKANGYLTVTAGDGKEGVDAAEREKPSLILMDVRMPVMDGFEALAKLRENPETRAIPVIALTAYAMREDRDRIAKAGFTAYMPKPFDIDELLSRIAQLTGP